MSKTAFHTFFIIGFMLSACVSSLKQEEVPAYLEKHDLMLEKDINSIKYKASLVSNEIITRQLIVGASGKDQIDSLKSVYEKYFYFSVEVSKSGTDLLASQAGTPQYNEVIRNFEFGIGEKANLTTDQGDTLQLLDYSFPRTYGLTNSSKILFVFEKPDLVKTEYIEFTLGDFGFNTGDVRFRFRTKNIQKFLNKRIVFTD